MKRIILIALLAASPAAAQQRTFYGPDGRVVQRSVTDSGGQTTFYGQDGRVTGRAIHSPSGTTTFYGPDGRRLGQEVPR